MNAVTAFPQSLSVEKRKKHTARRTSILLFAHRALVSRAPCWAVTQGAQRLAPRLGQEAGRKQPTPSLHSSICAAPMDVMGGSPLIILRTAHGTVPAVLLGSLMVSPPEPLQGIVKMSTQGPRSTHLPACPGGRDEKITPVLLAVLGLNAITRNAGFPQDSLSLACGWLKTTNRRPWYTEEKYITKNNSRRGKRTKNFPKINCYILPTIKVPWTVMHYFYWIK